jgi:hypothetical protein
MGCEVIILRQRQDAGQLERGIEEFDIRIIEMRSQPFGGDERVGGGGHGLKISGVTHSIVMAGLDPAIHLL